MSLSRDTPTRLESWWWEASCVAVERLCFVAGAREKFGRPESGIIGRATKQESGVLSGWWSGDDAGISFLFDDWLRLAKGNLNNSRRLDRTRQLMTGARQQLL